MDKERISQVFRNIIENAIKFTDKGKIEVILDETILSYKICIKDTGIGIDSQYLSALFEPFTKFNNNQYSKGLGLGLFIARKIIEDHKGEITVNSELGQGCDFRIELPKNKN